MTLKWTETRFWALAVLIAAIFALRGCPDPYPPLSPNVKRIAEVPYALGYAASGQGYALKPLLLDVLAPTDGPPTDRPAVLLVHGGGFEGGSRTATPLVLFADALASQGCVCFLIDYRTTEDRPPAPAPFDQTPLERAGHAATVDTGVALRFIAANATDYGVDPGRIALFGESAGAIAVLALGVSDAGAFASDGPEFSVPPENLPGSPGKAQAILEFWGTADRFLDRFDAADPPMLIVHGENDQNPATPFSDAQAIMSACVAAGIPHRFLPLPGENHGAWGASVDGQNLAEAALKFLEEFMP